ncbi:MAG: hypothetical protein AAF074_14910 [Pseudomonadota bacterium]
MLADRHREAVEAARRLIQTRAKEGRHHVAATVLTAAGGSYTAVNTDCVLGRAAICAEGIAVGMACAAEAEAEVVFCAAVNRRLVVIPPCGVCRELLLDYGPAALIAVPAEGADFRAVSLQALVPYAYKAGLRGV